MRAKDAFPLLFKLKPSYSLRDPVLRLSDVPSNERRKALEQIYLAVDQE